MTSESKSQTEPWVEKHSAGYPYAIDTKRALASFAGVRGIPHAILVDPTGTVVWAGSPFGLTGSIIEEHLEGALPMPLYDFPKEASKVKKALLADDLGKALQAARELGEDVPSSIEILEAVEGIIELRTGQVNDAHGKGDFLTVLEKGEGLVKALKGLPQADEIALLIEAVEADEAAMDVVAVQRKIAKLDEDLGKVKKGKQADKLLKKAKKLKEDANGSFAAEQLEKLISDIRAAKVKLG